ncbi:MAG: NAD(P)H-binding protein [Actinomycetia bacterium]|nr:NAD(P)H-binding protein [Actinomycetes bacterium]
MIVLIGATSFIGPTVLKKLLEKDYEVKCFVKSGTDISSLQQTASALKKEITLARGNLNSADTIFSCAKKAEAIVYLTDLKNSYYVKNTLSSAARAGVKRIVFLGSTTVLVPQETKIKQDKIASEKMIEKSGLDYTILRASMIYGSENDTNFSKMIKYIKDKGYFYLFGKGDNLIQPVYIEDVATAIAEVIANEKTYNKTYELAGKEPIKYSQMLDIVKEKMGLDFKIRKVPMGLASFIVSIYSKMSKNPHLTPDQIQRLKYDKTYSYSQAQQDFGFSPLSFEQGIEKLVNRLKLQ